MYLSLSGILIGYLMINNIITDLLSECIIIISCKDRVIFAYRICCGSKLYYTNILAFKNL